MYNPNNHYWFVAGDESQVWSSAVMDYVPTGDTTYQAWRAVPDNYTTRIPAAQDLCAVIQEQAFAGYFATGLVIESGSHPSINGVYGLDSTTLDQIGTVARDVGAGLGFPMGAPVFQYPDLDGAMKTLTEADVQAIYKAMRNYIAATTYAIQTRILGGSASLPSNVVPIA